MRSNDIIYPACRCVQYKLKQHPSFPSLSLLSLVRTEGYRKVPYHYYEVGSRDECAEYLLHESAPYGGHRFITEKAVFAKWAKMHAIKFFNPEWQLS